MATLGRYKLQAELGSGGQCTVYRAFDPALGRPVAVKVLHAHLARAPRMRARFRREGDALAKVRHPNVVIVYDAGEADGRPFLAMELVEGESLAALVARRGLLPAREAAGIIHQLAAALDAIHAHGLVHRDIKPENVIIETGTGRVVLLDLGIAHDLTRTPTSGGLYGTLAYMAPEQVEGSGKITQRTDVYQLAATAYALLTGRPPFQGDNKQILFAVAYRQPEEPSKVCADIPSALSTLVMWGLAKDANHRPRNPREFADAFMLAASPPQAFVGQLLQEASTHTTATRIPPRPRSRNMTRWLSVGVALAALSAVLVLRLTDIADTPRGDDTPDPGVAYATPLPASTPTVTMRNTPLATPVTQTVATALPTRTPEPSPATPLPKASATVTPQPQPPRTTPAPTPTPPGGYLVSDKPRVCGLEGAFEGTSLYTTNPIFKRPVGYSRGWITTDPAIVRLPDGREWRLPERSVIIVEDVPEVQIRGVPIGDRAHANSWGCHYRSDLTGRVNPDAEEELKRMRTDAPNVPAGLYRLSPNGLELVHR